METEEDRKRTEIMKENSKPERFNVMSKFDIEKGKKIDCNLNKNKIEKLKILEEKDMAYSHNDILMSTNRYLVSDNSETHDEMGKSDKLEKFSGLDDEPVRGDLSDKHQKADIDNAEVNSQKMSNAKHNSLEVGFESIKEIPKELKTADPLSENKIDKEFVNQENEIAKISEENLADNSMDFKETEVVFEKQNETTDYSKDDTKPYVFFFVYKKNLGS